MKDFFVSTWIIVIIAVVVVGAGLGLGLGFGLRDGEEGPATASLPTWSEGNQCVYEASMPDTTPYTGDLTLTVTGQGTVDGVDCYTGDFTFDPALWGLISSGDIWVEKDTLLQKKREMSLIVYPYFHIVQEWSYDFDEALWPLEVGKEVGVTETYNETVEDTLTYTETISGTYKVEGKEKITVTAGTFDCFKVILRAEDGTLRAELWYSEQVKSWVKMAFYDANGDLTESEELQSYSV